jgi:hypothetical protein
MKIVYEVLQQGIDAGEFRNVNVRLTGSLLINWINSALRFLPTLSQQEISRRSLTIWSECCCRPLRWLRPPADHRRSRPS